MTNKGMKRNLLATVFLLVSTSFLLFPTGCKKDTTYRGTSPHVEDSNLALLIKGNTEFSFEFYRAMSKQDENMVFSPVNINTGIAMAYAGARGNTAEGIKKVMRYELGDDVLHAKLAEFDGILHSRNLQIDGRHMILKTANSLWIQDGFQVNKSFSDLLLENYRSEPRFVPFDSQAEDCIEAMNNWIDENTEGLIVDPITTDNWITPIYMIILGTIYFDGSWVYPFNEADTMDHSFNLLDGGTAEVKMMFGHNSYYYTAGDVFQVVEIPYVSRDISMIIFLPREGEFENFESIMSYELLASALEDLEEHDFTLGLPRFEFSTEYGLSDILTGMGMTDAFSTDADFSGICEMGIWLEEIQHVTRIIVNEKGTKAASLIKDTFTYGGVGITELIIDRPFIFFIRDIPTDAILFMGRVLNPSSGSPTSE